MGAAPAGAATPGGAPAPVRAIRLVALDLDGVVWRGDEVLPGVVEALQEVLRRGLDLRYVSNNSTAHRTTVADRLADLGLPAGTERVLTSGFIAGRWLRERLPEGAPVLVVGEEGLERELREAGLAPRRAGAGGVSGAEPGAPGGAEPGAAALGAVAPRVAPPAEAVPKAVVVGMDRQFDYAALAEAQAAVMSGALFVATNRDATFPTAHGLKPGAGAIVAAVATAAEQEPVLLGKPGLALAEVLAAMTGVPPAETLMVGDRLSTDIAMGRAAGMVTVLVLTGVTSQEDLEAARAAGSDELLPDYVLAGLAALPGLLAALDRSTTLNG